jgi:hypothetical protein
METLYQGVQALIDKLPSDVQYGFSITESFHNSLTQSILYQIKADGITLQATATMANVEQLKKLLQYIQHANNAKHKIHDNISHIINISVGQNRGANRGNVFLVGASSQHGMDPHEKRSPHELITDDPYQGTPHKLLAQASLADMLYDMMLKEGEEEFQCTHCFLAPKNSRWYVSGSPVNAALTQASKIPYALEYWGCINHSNPKQHAEQYPPLWRNCPHKFDPETAKYAKQGLSKYYKRRDKNTKPELPAHRKEISLPSKECREHYHGPKKHHSSQTSCCCHHGQVPSIREHP